MGKPKYIVSSIANTWANSNTLLQTFDNVFAFNNADDAFAFDNVFAFDNADDVFAFDNVDNADNAFAFDNAFMPHFDHTGMHLRMSCNKFDNAFELFAIELTMYLGLRILSALEFHDYHFYSKLETFIQLDC